MASGSLRVDGGTVVAWNGSSHALLPGGSVLVEGGVITYVGKERRAADTVVDATGRLVCPGFINLHVHSQLNVGDYLLADQSKRDYLGANYFVFGAPVKGRLPTQPKEAVAIGREFSLLTSLLNGSTTVLDPGGGDGDYDDYVGIVERLGIRSYFAPRYRSTDVFTDEEGRHYYEDCADRGRPGLEEAVAFIRKHNGAANGRLRGVMNPAQAEMCEPELFQETMAVAKELDVPVHTHIGGNYREFLEILNRYRKSPIEYLADAGALGPRTILGHAVFIAGHSKVAYKADDVATLAATHTSVCHCVHKYAKMAMAMESFDRYVGRGVNVGLGTDTYPLDIIAEMRYASRVNRIVDADHQAGRPADVFNAATVWGAKALGREDLGRLAPGARGDIVVVNVADPHYGPHRDPVTALVDYGSGRDVETVIVDGTIVVKDSRSTMVDTDEVFARAQASATRAWDNWANRDWAHRSVEDILPPAFPDMPS